MRLLDVSDAWDTFKAWYSGPGRFPSNTLVVDNTPLHTNGFDVMMDDHIQAFRCQHCASDKPWRLAFGPTDIEREGMILKGPPAGLFLWTTHGDPDQINRTLEIHRRRCPARGIPLVSEVVGPS